MISVRQYFIFLWIGLVSLSANAGVKNEAIILKTMPVIKTELMRDFLISKKRNVDFDSEVYLVTLQDGTQAVFKPVPVDDPGDAYAEVAAYKASQFLGFPRVPVTVLREINGKMGSLQQYIEPNVNLCDLKVYQEIMQQAPVDDIANLKLFYFIFGQWDSGHHNMIVQKNGKDIKIYAIDNSGIRQRQQVKYGSLPFVRLCYNDEFKTNDWEAPFPFEAIKIIKKPNIKNVQGTFGHKISDVTFKQLIKREDPIYYVLYRNSVWMQHHASDPTFVLSHTDYYPEKTIELIKKLTLKDLENIYSVAKGSDFLAEAYFKAILERRDQVLSAYAQHHLTNF